MMSYKNPSFALANILWPIEKKDKFYNKKLHYFIVHIGCYLNYNIGHIAEGWTY